MTSRQRIFICLSVIILTLSVLEIMTDYLEQQQSLKYQIDEALNNLEHSADVAIHFDATGPVQNLAEPIPFNSRVRVLEGSNVLLTVDQSTPGAMLVTRNKAVSSVYTFEFAVDIRTFRAVLIDSFWRDLRYDALSIILALGLSWWVSGFALRPIQRLAQAIAQANQSKFPQPILLESKDECSAIAAGFNQAVDAARVSLEREHMLMRYVAREISIPLGQMSSDIEDLALGVKPDEKVVPLVQRSLERMHQVWQTLPHLSQAVPLTSHPTSLITLLKETIQLIPDAQQYRIGLKISTSSNPKVNQPALIAQCVLSLLDNALQSKGEIKVTLEPYEAMARVRIEDYGLGFAKEQIAQLKQPLTSFPVLVDDSLLRLTFVRHMIQNLGGQMDIRKTDRGLEVIMTLPVVTSTSPTLIQEYSLTATQINSKVEPVTEKVNS
jgi:signal transduction histidine kinase